MSFVENFSLFEDLTTSAEDCRQAVCDARDAEDQIPSRSSITPVNTGVPSVLSESDPHNPGEPPSEHDPYVYPPSFLHINTSRDADLFQHYLDSLLTWVGLATTHFCTIPRL